MDKKSKNKNFSDDNLKDRTYVNKTIDQALQIIIESQMKKMTYDEMKLASRLSANLINGVRVVPDTTSPAVNVLLSELKKQSRNDVIYVTQYINRSIVEKNEADNEPSDDTQRIYDEMMWD